MSLKTVCTNQIEFSPLFVFYVFSNCLPLRMQSHIGCIHLTFLQCVFSDASLTRLPEKIQSHIGCTCLVFLHSGFSNVLSNCLGQRMHNHTGCIGLFFSTVSFKMLTQRAWIRAGKVTLAAFVWLFSTMCFQMRPQIACLREDLLKKECLLSGIAQIRGGALPEFFGPFFSQYSRP